MPLPQSPTERVLLDDVVSPLSLGEFLDTTYGRTYRVFRGTPGRFAHLLSEPTILEILRRERYDPALITLLHQGREVPRPRFCARHPADGKTQLEMPMVQGLLVGGAAMIIAQLHRRHRPLAELTHAMAQVLRADVNVNVYLGGPSSRGFDLHVDHHDVFVLQVTGRKRWFIAPATYPAPLVVPDHTGVAPTEMEWTGILEEGDALYLPRGVWHRAEATDGAPTLHLSCGVQPCTGLHIIHWLAKEMMADSRFRAELPRLGRDSTNALEARSAELRQFLIDVWDERLMTRFLEQHDSRVERESLEILNALGSPQNK